MVIPRRIARRPHGSRRGGRAGPDFGLGSSARPRALRSGSRCRARRPGGPPVARAEIGRPQRYTTQTCLSSRRASAASIRATFAVARRAGRGPARRSKTWPAAAARDRRSSGPGATIASPSSASEARALGEQGGARGVEVDRIHRRMLRRVDRGRSATRYTPMQYRVTDQTRRSAMAIEIDPVCGMEVDTTTSELSLRVRRARRTGSAAGAACSTSRTTRPSTWTRTTPRPCERVGRRRRRCAVQVAENGLHSAHAGPRGLVPDRDRAPRRGAGEHDLLRDLPRRRRVRGGRPRLRRPRQPRSGSRPSSPIAVAMVGVVRRPAVPQPAAAAARRRRRLTPGRPRRVRRPARARHSTRSATSSIPATSGWPARSGWPSPTTTRRSTAGAPVIVSAVRGTTLAVRPAGSASASRSRRPDMDTRH